MGKVKWLTMREGEAYCATLAPMRELYLLKEDNGTWSLWWGQWGNDMGSKPIKEKTLATGLTFEQAAARGNSYLEWWFSKNKG